MEVKGLQKERERIVAENLENTYNHKEENNHPNSYQE